MNLGVIIFLYVIGMIITGLMIITGSELISGYFLIDSAINGVIFTLIAYIADKIGL